MGLTSLGAVVLFLHNRYRTTGGEERVVEDLLWLVREHLGEEAELLERDSARLGRARAAAGLLRGGLDPDDVGAAVRRTRARVVHAHNLNPAFGWRALAAARAAGARVVLHLHNYRLVCAVGTCFTRGEDCTRCHGRDTAPGIALNCRGTGPEAVVYGAALALYQRRLTGHADAVVVPSRAALERLGALRAPLDRPRVRIVAHPLRAFAPEPAVAPGGPALVVSRLAPEKGVDVAVGACRPARRRWRPGGGGTRRPPPRGWPVSARSARPSMSPPLWLERGDPLGAPGRRDVRAAHAHEHAVGPAARDADPPRVARRGRV